MQRNFDEERVVAVSEIIKDLYTIQQLGVKVGNSFNNGEGVPGKLNIDGAKIVKHFILCRKLELI